MATLTFALAALATGAAGAAGAWAGGGPSLAPVQDPPVRVWLSDRGPFDQGDRVRVRIRTDLDGYVLVLHAEPDGRVRVLFPLDPYDDNYVRGGEDFEIRGRGDREAFRVFEESGDGAVYAASSRDPFQVAQFVRGDHWNYLLDAWRVDDDAEAELTALVQQMATGSFDYDVVRYAVGRSVAYRDAYEPRPYTSYSFGVAFGLGRYHAPLWYRFRYAYYASHCYDWYWYDPAMCGPFYTAYFVRDPWFPYWYDPWYDPYYYRAYYYGYYPYRYHSTRVYVYSYHPRVVYRDVRFYDPKQYYFKGDHGAAGASSLIAMRRRSPSDGIGVRRRAPEPAPVAVGGVATSGRRVVDTGRRVPAAEPVMARTPDGRRVPDAGGPSVAPPREGRRVLPEGWGITDGRRVISPPERPRDPSRPEVETPDARRATPRVDRPEPDVRRPDNEPTAVRRPAPATPNRDVTPRGDVQRRQPAERRPAGGATVEQRAVTPSGRRVQPDRPAARQSTPVRQPTGVPAARRSTSFERAPASYHRSGSEVRAVPSDARRVTAPVPRVEQRVPRVEQRPRVRGRDERDG